jgi:hypothetical protein
MAIAQIRGCKPGYGVRPDGFCYKLPRAHHADESSGYQFATEPVLVEQERRVTRAQPAEYGYVPEKILLRSAYTVPHRSPATYRIVSERVLVAPEHQARKVTRNIFGQNMLCWVTVPAKYATRQRRVLVPEAITYEIVPPVYGERQRRVETRPATTTYDIVPAVYENRYRTVGPDPDQRY